MMPMNLASKTQDSFQFSSKLGVNLRLMLLLIDELTPYAGYLAKLIKISSDDVLKTQSQSTSL